ncbi:MAG: PIN domain-containing protein [Actinomycetota bacterium]|nr:PIN domain-containing protein [Actinomycetota bacterium]
MPIRLTDLLLRLAEAQLFRPLWSADVLDEVERTLPRIDPRLTVDKARSRVHRMRAAFPDAEVTGYDSLIEAMTNHPKDRHVLAAAARGDAAVIATFNIKDFPAEALAPYDIDAVNPDDFLLDQPDLHPRETVQCLLEQIAAKRRPPESIRDFLSRFGNTVPGFCDRVGELDLIAPGS